MSKASRSYRALPAITIDQLQKLGRDIAVARKRRHLSMRDMAERTMVNLKTVQRLEKATDRGLGIVAGALWILAGPPPWRSCRAGERYYRLAGGHQESAERFSQGEETSRQYDF